VQGSPVPDQPVNRRAGPDVSGPRPGGAGESAGMSRRLAALGAARGPLQFIAGGRGALRILTALAAPVFVWRGQDDRPSAAWFSTASYEALRITAFYSGLPLADAVPPLPRGRVPAISH